MKILRFWKIPVNATRENLADIIVKSMLDWKLRIFAPLSWIATALKVLLHRDLQAFLPLDGRHRQGCCWVHIINFVAQDGLDEIEDYISRVRAAVKYVKSSP